MDEFNGKTRHLPLLVVDKKIGYRGMISMRDLLKVIASDQKARADITQSLRIHPAVEEAGCCYQSRALAKLTRPTLE